MPGKLSDLLRAPLFARGYYRFNKTAEDTGVREKRRALLARAEGRTSRSAPAPASTSTSIQTPSPSWC